MSEHHIHEPVVQVTASGKTLKDAVSIGVAGLADPKGHHGTLSFDLLKFSRSRVPSAISPAAMGTPDMSRYCCRRLVPTAGDPGRYSRLQCT